MAEAKKSSKRSNTKATSAKNAGRKTEVERLCDL